MIAEFFDKKIKRKGKVSDLRTPVLHYSTILFTIGMIFDLFLYHQHEKHLSFFINGIGILTISLIWIIFRFGKIDINKAVICHILAVALNLYLRIISEAFFPMEDTAKNILFTMTVCMIPVIHAGVSTVRYLPLFIALGALLCYTIASLYLMDTTLLYSLPILVFVFIGGAVTVWHLLDVSKSLEHENLKAKDQEQQLIRFFSLHPQQWTMIKEGKLTKKDAEKLLNKLENRTRYKLMMQFKDIVQDEVDTKDILRTKYPQLTSGELQLCYYVIGGLSVAEISDIRGVASSTITSMRSRLRSKLNLEMQDNLKDHLESVVRKQIKIVGSV